MEVYDEKPELNEFFVAPDWDPAIEKKGRRKYDPRNTEPVLY